MSKAAQQIIIGRKAHSGRLLVQDRASAYKYSLTNEERRTVKEEYALPLHAKQPLLCDVAAMLKEQIGDIEPLIFTDLLTTFYACSGSSALAALDLKLASLIVHGAHVHGWEPLAVSTSWDTTTSTLLAYWSRKHRRDVDETIVISGELSRPADEVHGFAPSEKVTRFLVQRAKATGQATTDDAQFHTAASEQVKEAVIGFLHSLAESVRQAGEGEYLLGTNGRFEEPVVKALLYRVAVGFYESFEFVAELFREVRQAASTGDISGTFWRAKTKEDGSLLLAIDRASLQPTHSPRRAKAKAVKVAAKSSA